MDVRRNKWRKDGEHCAGVCIRAQHISERIFPNNHHHTQTGSHNDDYWFQHHADYEHLRPRHPDSPTKSKVNREWVRFKTTAGFRNANWSIVIRFPVRKEIFTVLRSIKTGSGYGLGSYSTGTRCLFSIRETAGA